MTFWALGEIVKARAGILETDDPEEAGSRIDALVGDDDPDAPRLRARLRPLVGLPAPQAERAENFAAWRTFLERIAESGPTVVLVEDLHWADAALLEFVEHVADDAEGVPLVLLGTARPELYERSPSFGTGARNATRINLTPLSPPETAGLISGLLEATVLPAEVQATVVERSGGNPLYAEEFVGLLIDRGILARSGPTWRLDTTAELPLPGTIQALIAARLDALSADRKRLLSDASVVGRVFWSGAVLAMAPDRDPHDVDRALHELSRKELIRPARRSSMANESEFSFSHALVRDVSYGEIPRARRAGKHVAVATWIEAKAGDRVADHAEILASHYTQALDLARAARTEDTLPGIKESACRFLTLAGEHAMALDVGSAQASLRRALELAPDSGPTRARVLAKLANAVQQGNNLKEAEGHYEEAAAGFRALGLESEVAEVTVELSHLIELRGDTVRGRAMGQEALDVLLRHPPGRALARAAARKAGALLVGSRYREAIESADFALSLAQRADALDLEAFVRSIRGGARVALGDAEGLNDVREALVRARDSGAGYITAVLYNNLAEYLRSVEGPAASVAVLMEGIEFAERRGLTEIAGWMRTCVIEPLTVLGRWDEGERTVETAIAQARRSGGDYTAALGASNRSIIQAYRGEADDELMAEVLTDARQMGDPQVVVPALAAAAIGCAVGTYGGSIAGLIEELVEATSSGGEDRVVMFLPELVRSAVATGHLPHAVLLIERAGEQLLPGLSHAVEAARAAVLEAQGHTGEALAAYERSQGAWTEFGNVPERAHALMGQGRCLIASGRPDESRARLQEARAIFADLRARPLVAEADSLLSQVIALSS